MQALEIIFAVLTIAVIVGQGLLYLRKDGINGIVIFNVILALIIAFMSYTSFPNNYNTQRMVAGALGALSILAAILFYMKINPAVSKLMLSVSTIGGLIYLFLGI